MDKDIIINLYKNQFKNICLYLIKCGCPVDDAEDIVHDSFIKSIEYIDGVAIKSLSSWLFRVSINSYKNYLKRCKRLNSISVDEENFYTQLVSDTSVEEAVLSKEKSIQIANVLNSLNQQYSSLLIFKYEMDLSYKEIATLLGLNEAVVKTYLYRARNKFKEEWNKNYE